MHANYIRPGGVAQDIPVGTLASIYNFSRTFISRIEEIEDMLTTNRIWGGRLKGVGIATPRAAIGWGFSGVMLRASGIQWDLRKASPYAVYNNLAFRIPVGLNADCFDRYLVRIQELRESCGILQQCVNNIPEGEIAAMDFKRVRPARPLMKNSIQAMIQHFKIVSTGPELGSGIIYASLEAPKGEFGVFISADGESISPERVKIRAPGFYHLQGLQLLAPQHLLADVVVILGSQDIVFGEVDR